MKKSENGILLRHLFEKKISWKLFEQKTLEHYDSSSQGQTERFERNSGGGEDQQQ